MNRWKIILILITIIVFLKLGIWVEKNHLTFHFKNHQITKRTTVDQIKINKLIQENYFKQNLAYMLNLNYEYIDEAWKFDNKYILISLIYEESRGKKYSISSENAIGPAQIIYKWWQKDLTKVGICSQYDLFDRRKSVDAAHLVLDKCIKICHGSVRKGLGYYNTGICQENGYSKAILERSWRLEWLSGFKVFPTQLDVVKN